MKNPAFNRFVFVLALVGVMISAMLWKLHATPELIPCGAGSSGCTDVAQSGWSEFPPGSGIPVALWGTFGYLGIAGIAFLRTLPSLAGRARTLLLLNLAASAGALLFSFWLTYLELFVIHAICKWCVGSQCVIIAIFTLCAVEASGVLRRPAAVDPT